MYEYLSKQMALFIQKYVPPQPNQNKQEQYEILKYGTHSILLTIFKTLLLILLAFILHIVPYVLTISAVYGTLRLFSYGVHLKNTLACTAVSLIYYIGGVYISIYSKTPFIISILIIPICSVFFTLYAPSSYENTPIAKSKRKKLKLMSLFVLAVCFILSVWFFKIGNTLYSNLINSAVICQTINILPITYKIFREERK